MTTNTTQQSKALNKTLAEWRAFKSNVTTSSANVTAKHFKPDNLKQELNKLKNPPPLESRRHLRR